MNRIFGASTKSARDFHHSPRSAIEKRQDLSSIIFMLKCLRFVGICPYKISKDLIVPSINLYNILTLIFIHGFAIYYTITRLYSLAGHSGILGIFTRIESFIRIGCCVITVDMLFIKRRQILELIIELNDIEKEYTNIFEVTKKTSRAIYKYTTVDSVVFLMYFAISVYFSMGMEVTALKTKWDGNLFSDNFIKNYPRLVKIIFVTDTAVYCTGIYYGVPCRNLFVSFCTTVKSNIQNNLKYNTREKDLINLLFRAIHLKMFVSKLDGLYRNLILVWCFEEIFLATVGTSRLITDLVSNGQFSFRALHALFYIFKEIFAFMVISMSAANIPVCYKGAVDEIQEKVQKEGDKEGEKSQLERHKIVDRMGFYRLELTGADTFSLTRSFTTTVCSGVVTFVVILVQFTPKSKD